MIEAAETGIQFGALETPDWFLERHQIGRVEGLEDRLLADGAPPPSKVMLTGMSGVRDQGDRRTCVAFGAVALLEFINTTAAPNIDLSEGHLIAGSERMCGDCKGDGHFLACAMKYLFEKGICEERWWRYQDYIETCPSPQPNLAQKKLFSFQRTEVVYKVSRSEIEARLNDATDQSGNGPITDRIRLYLAGWRNPVGAEIATFQQCGWVLDGSGDIVEPAVANNPDYHTIAIYGYDDSTRRFHFKNSWGNRFGKTGPKPGFGTIPYRYLDRFSSFGMVGA